MLKYIDLWKEEKSKTGRTVKRNIRRGDKNFRKYTPFIADTKYGLLKVESDIEEGKDQIYIIGKEVEKMKHKQYLIDQIAEMNSILVDNKRELCLLKKRVIQTKAQVKQVCLQVEKDIKMRITVLASRILEENKN